MYYTSSRYYTRSFFSLIVIFGPSVSAVWSKLLAVLFLFIRLSGFGLMDPTPFILIFYKILMNQPVHRLTITWLGNALHVRPNSFFRFFFNNFSKRMIKFCLYYPKYSSSIIPSRAKLGWPDWSREAENRFGYRFYIIGMFWCVSTVGGWQLLPVVV